MLGVDEKRKPKKRMTGDSVTLVIIFVCLKQTFLV